MAMAIAIFDWRKRIGSAFWGRGKARPHRWAPEQGYVTFMARDEKDLAPAMELIRMSHDHFAAENRECASAKKDDVETTKEINSAAT